MTMHIDFFTQLLSRLHGQLYSCKLSPNVSECANTALAKSMKAIWPLVYLSAIISQILKIADNTDFLI